MCVAIYMQATAAQAAVQQGGFPGQSMGPPAHASPMLQGNNNGDPAMGPPPGGVRPSMGMMPPGTGSPAMNPAMQTFSGGAPPGTAPQASQQQQQQLIQKMQSCMTNAKKLQTMLTAGQLCCQTCQGSIC